MESGARPKAVDGQKPFCEARILVKEHTGKDMPQMQMIRLFVVLGLSSAALFGFANEPSKSVPTIDQIFMQSVDQAGNCRQQAMVLLDVLASEGEEQ